MSRVLIKCLTPHRRDALEELARLALSFVTVTCGPGFPEFKCSRDLSVHLSAPSLGDGCHLPDLAQELLEAVQAHGIQVCKVVEPDTEVAAEWKEWWVALPEAGQEEFELVLEIR